MSQGVISVTLNRDGPATPWGFRLHGGKDIGYPLAIQRVFLGSPSEGELHRGDIILQVGDKDASELTHMEAHDIIKSAGNQLRLLVHRLPGAPQSPGAYSPQNPATLRREQHPLVNVSGVSPYTATSFQPMSPHKINPVPQASAPKPWNANHNAYSVAALPTTPVLDNQVSSGGFFAPSSQNARLNEVFEYRQEKSREKAAIVHQGYRTVPLISPKPKTRHDVPIGSYLRHVHDPAWKARSAFPPPSKPFFMNQMQTQTYSSKMEGTGGGGFNAHSVTQPLGENSQLVHRQYNSPLNIYSQEAVQETIQEQTGLQPKNKPLPGLLTTVNLVAQPGAPLSPVSPVGNLTPAKPGTKLTNIVDITLSPTFQMIQETEHRSASPRPEVKSPTIPPRFSSVGAAVGSPKPCAFEQDRVNPFGSSKDVIHQSGSFKTLMATLALTGQ